MDFLAHAVYGATVCSRSGFAGGARGAGRPGLADPTVWWAVLFGLLPDVFSLGPPLLAYGLTGQLVDFVHSLSETDLTTYHYLHSLVVAVPAVGLVRLLLPRFFVPSLAWILHILMDAGLHGAGLFQTTLFYPLSNWTFEGLMRWWHHPRFVLAYWAAVPLLWLGLWIWRRRGQAQARPAR